MVLRNFLDEKASFLQVAIVLTCFQSEKSQNNLHADRGRLLLRTSGPVPLGLAYVLLVETNLFPNLSLFYRTMLFEYPSVLSRFCLWFDANRFVKRFTKFVKINLRGEKGRDLTQSYDKSPYTNRNVKRAKWQHKQRHNKVRLNSGCGPT